MMKETTLMKKETTLMTKQDYSEIKIEQESLTDIPLTPEQAGTTKGGTGGKCQVQDFSFVKKVES